MGNYNMESQELQQQVKQIQAHFGYTTIKQIAGHFGYKRAAFSHYMNGRNPFPEELQSKIAAEYAALFGESTQSTITTFTCITSDTPVGKTIGADGAGPPRTVVTAEYGVCCETADNVLFQFRGVQA